MITTPIPLNQNHELSQFNCGNHDTLNDWLKFRSLKSEGLSARTYVVCPINEMSVIGYYCISTAIAQRVNLPSAKLRQSMPDSVPMLLIGRLAIDQQWQGKGIGSALLQDALKRCCSASQIAGVRAIIVNALDENAVNFYSKYGFLHYPLGERTMLMPIEHALKLLP